MELVSVEKSVLVRLALVSRPAGQINAIDIINGIRNEFSFASFPETIKSAENNLEFSRGTVGEVYVSKLGIYSDGVVIESASPTYLLDRALDILTTWAKSMFGATIVETHGINRIYESNIVVRAKHDLLSLNKKLGRLQKELQGALKSASDMDVPFEVASIGISPDLQRIGGMKPVPFRVARHGTAEFSSNLFQSTASLPTDQHLRILKMLEEINP